MTSRRGISRSFIWILTQLQLSTKLQFLRKLFILFCLNLQYFTNDQFAFQITQTALRYLLVILCLCIIIWKWIFNSVVLNSYSIIRSISRIRKSCVESRSKPRFVLFSLISLCSLHIEPSIIFASPISKYFMFKNSILYLYCGVIGGCTRAWFVWLLLHWTLVKPRF